VTHKTTPALVLALRSALDKVKALREEKSAIEARLRNVAAEETTLRTINAVLAEIEPLLGNGVPVHLERAPGGFRFKPVPGKSAAKKPKQQKAAPGGTPTGQGGRILGYLRMVHSPRHTNDVAKATKVSVDSVTAYLSKFARMGLLTRTAPATYAATTRG
jgi:hypothetical protein